ncbi:MAG: VWA domain-containing protein, partial [Thermoanaerobaculia bacterium]
TSTFVDTVEVRVVNVDVVVLDLDGRPVTGLAREDFVLTVDGRPVELSNFAAYDEAATLRASLEAISAPPAEGAPGSPALAAPPSTWIVYVDQSNVQPGPRGELARSVSDFLASSLRTGDRSMVATFDGKSLKFLSSLSEDRAPALAALAKLQRRAGFPSGLLGRASQIQAGIASLDPGSRGASSQVEILRYEIERLDEDLALRQRAAFQALRDLLSLVAGVEGRVALIYGGGGFESDPVGNLYRMLEAKLTGRFNPGLDPRRERDLLAAQNRVDYERLLTEVNASRVTVYSVFAGEGRAPGLSAEFGGSPEASGPSLSLEGREADTSLAAFATATGGRSFVSAPDLGEQLETAQRDFASYYSLGYHPVVSDPGGFHDLKVTVRREGVRVLHRRGVQERTAEQVAGNAATEALIAAAPPKNPFGAVIRVGEVTKAKLGRAMRVPVRVLVPLRAVTLLPAGAAHHASLSYHFTLRDPDGGYRRLEPRPLAFDVPGEKLAAALDQRFSFEIVLELEPGAYQLAAAVVDTLGGATSVATVGFEASKRR